MAVTPIFILSLPRSGSTLLQRILVSSGLVTSTAEPWLILPLVYARKQDGLLARYWHNYAVKGLKEFIADLPGNEKDYQAEVRNFVLALYEKKAQGKKFFLDKTPRYHLICEDIYKIFPDAKFIILWRNPLAVASSILTSWCKNRWKISLFNVDTDEGVSGLLSFYKNNRNNVYALRYEDLAADPETAVKNVFTYLGLDYDSSCLQDFNNVKFSGSLGDKAGVKKYNVVSSDSINSWIETFNNRFRLNWALRYLKSIGEEDLKTMGYDYKELEKTIMSSLDALTLRSYLSLLEDLCCVVLVHWRLFVARQKGKYQYM